MSHLFLGKLEYRLKCQCFPRLVVGPTGRAISKCVVNTVNANTVNANARRHDYDHL